MAFPPGSASIHMTVIHSTILPFYRTFFSIIVTKPVVTQDMNSHFNNGCRYSLVTHYFFVPFLSGSLADAHRIAFGMSLLHEQIHNRAVCTFTPCPLPCPSFVGLVHPFTTGSKPDAVTSLGGHMPSTHSQMLRRRALRNTPTPWHPPALYPPYARIHPLSYC